MAEISLYSRLDQIFVKSYLTVLFLAGIIPAFAQGPIKATYHNVTARYNAYFYAKQRILEVESALAENYEWNYNRILPIYPQYDTIFSQSQETALEDCIKKASISIQRHPESKWEYDSYILVGKARLYGSEFPEAIETFKYVNTKSDNKNERHAALVELLKTFVEAKEYNNAESVSDFLSKEKLNGENLRKLYLNRAYLYQRRKNNDKTVANLVLAEALMPNGKERGRLNFIIGQIYQELGFDAEAFRYYKNTLKSGPAYELAFYTKLNMAQVTQLKRNSDRRKVEKYFKKLLRDPKNLDYKDKIYYEMGAFELKQGNLNEAIENYQSSVASSTNNNRQKSYSYWQLSKIYYDSLANYEQAKLYYDSTVSTMPKDEEAYASIAERQKILEEFVKHISTIRVNDSLLTLAEMNSDELDLLLDEIIAQEIDRQNEEKKRKKKEERRQQTRSNNFNGPTEAGTISTTTEGVWYFYNNTSVSRGRSEFIRKWGQRELEDNWRRRNKIAAENEIASADQAIETGESAENAEEEEEEFDPAAMKEKYIAGIPFKLEDKTKLLGEIEEAYYQAGNIYNFQLEEKENAVDTFEKLIIRFDTSTYKPEVLYQLYLLYKPLDSIKSSDRANKLLQEFPESIYAKLIFNPRYREENLAKNQAVQKAYASAYNLFYAGDHKNSISIIDSTLRVYEESDYHDNLILLRILNVGRTENIYQYQFELNKFIVDHPDSDIGDYAQELAKAAEDHQINLFSSSKGRYIKSFDQSHHFIFVYSNPSLSESLPGEIQEILDKQNMNFSSANLVLDDKYSMVLVSDLPGKASGLSFLKIFHENSDLNQNYKDEIFYELIITKDNFNILYESKDLKTYLNFFDKNYQ